MTTEKNTFCLQELGTSLKPQSEERLADQSVVTWNQSLAKEPETRGWGGGGGSKAEKEQKQIQKVGMK
jgi:hypothetical protein